jgi:hypothetical protein
MQYLLDEHIDPRLRRSLKRLLPTLVVWCVGDVGAPSLGTLDPAILIWCEEHDFVLVTSNRRSMPVHLAEHLQERRHIPGILVIAPSMGLGDTAQELALIAQLALDGEFQDQIRYLPLTS